MSAIIINEFVDKFVALLGDGEHKEAMIVLATEFYNSTKKAVEKKAAAKKDGKEKKEKKEGGLKQPPNSAHLPKESKHPSASVDGECAEGGAGRAGGDVSGVPMV